MFGKGNCHVRFRKKKGRNTYDKRDSISINLERSRGTLIVPQLGISLHQLQFLLHFFRSLFIALRLDKAQNASNQMQRSGDENAHFVLIVFSLNAFN